jgi:hypothetical protein
LVKSGNGQDFPIPFSGLYVKETHEYTEYHLGVHHDLRDLESFIWRSWSALSMVIFLETSKWQMMFYQKNFFIVVELIFVTGFSSIHFVKYSTAMMAKV